jgi:hypothetical protein
MSWILKSGPRLLRVQVGGVSTELCGIHVDKAVLALEQGDPSQSCPELTA